MPGIHITNEMDYPEKKKRVRTRRRSKFQRENIRKDKSTGKRTCDYPGCITILSTTNPGPFCCYHTGELARKKMDEEIKKYNYDGMPIGKHSSKK